MNITDKLSPHYSKRSSGGEGKISAIIIHHTGDFIAGNAVRWFQNPDSKVSAHYVIERNGDITGCVPEIYKAWHAGKSSLFGRNNCNDYSIGIELVGDGNKEKYSHCQLVSLRNLVIDIRLRFGIPHNRIVGHEHISPGRKVDPGKLFPWFEFLDSVYSLRNI